MAYLLSPFVINLPYISGAKAKSLGFYILGNNTTGTPDIRTFTVVVSTQNLYTERYKSTFNIHTINNYPVTITPGGTFALNLVEKLVTIDLSHLYDIYYPQMLSYNKSVPIFITIVDSATKDPATISLKAPGYENIALRDINCIFEY